MNVIPAIEKQHVLCKCGLYSLYISMVNVECSARLSFVHSS